MPLARLLVQLVAVVLFGAGLIKLVQQLRELFRAWASRRWPKGDAEVVAATIREQRGRRGRLFYLPTIEFRYAFHGQEFSGRRIAFGEPWSGNRAKADDLIEHYAIGTRWAVSICERRPDLAVLHPGPNNRIWYGIAFFIVYTLLTTACMLGSFGLLRGY